MPRFHFNLYENDLASDRDLSDLNDHLDACRQALRIASEKLKDRVRDDVHGQDWRVEVTDEQGLVLYRLDVLLAPSAAVSKRCA